MSLIQNLTEGDIDIQAFSLFFNADAATEIPRRLNLPVQSLSHYEQYLEALKSVYTQTTGTVTVDGIAVKPVTVAVRDAIDAAILGDYKTQLEHQIASVSGGRKSYKTYAEMVAKKAEITANSIVDITNDTTENNGAYNYDGTTFTKSVYDPLTQANTYTDNKVKGVTNNFKTKALMTASTLPNDSYAMVIEDTEENNGLYIKTAGAWVKPKYMSKVSEIATGVEGSSLVTVEALVNSLSLGFSVNDFNLEFSKKGYYGKQGNYTANSAVRTTNNQFLGKGSTLRFRSYVSPSAGAAPVIVVIRDVNGLFESYLYTTTDNLGEYIEDSYTAENDCIISVSTYLDGADNSIYAKVGLKYSPATTQIAELKKSILPRGEFGGYDSYDYYLTGYYNVRGGFTTAGASGFRSTDKIEVSKGDLIGINAQAGGSELALLNLYDSSDVFIKTIKGSADAPREIINLTYVVEVDGYIAASSSVAAVDIDATKLLVYKKYNNYIVTYNDVGVTIPSYRDIEEIKPKSLSFGLRTIVEQDSSILLSGASFASIGNGWFELMASKLAVTPINKAVDSYGIGHLGRDLNAGTFFNQTILNSVSAFVIMHAWNYHIMSRKDVNIDGVEYTDEQLESWSAADYEATGWSWLSAVPTKTSWTDATMSAMWDYVLKKIQTIYYSEKDNPESVWHESASGKPFNIVLTTHWHDARTKYNSSVRELCAKWGCTLICFDDNIGFTKDKLHISGQQHSLLYSLQGGAGRETLDGVVYGWHPKGGQSSFIMRRLAAIASSAFKVI